MRGEGSKKEKKLKKISTSCSWCKTCPKATIVGHFIAKKNQNLIRIMVRLESYRRSVISSSCIYWLMHSTFGLHHKISLSCGSPDELIIEPASRTLRTSAFGFSQGRKSCILSGAKFDGILIAQSLAAAPSVAFPGNLSTDCSRRPASSTFIGNAAHLSQRGVRNETCTSTTPTASTRSIVVSLRDLHA